jgi:hypothetical protein
MTAASTCVVNIIVWTRRESNSRLCNANAAFYHLTTGPVGLLGIEPSLHAPEACVLPVYDSPKYTVIQPKTVQTI